MQEFALVGEIWQQQSIWSQTANRMKATITWARALGLTLTVASGVCGAAAGAFSSPAPLASTVFGISAAIGVGLVPMLRPRYTGGALRDWTRTRSVSEALKSEIFLYLARAGVYRGEERDRYLATTTAAVREQAIDLLPHTVEITAVERSLPDVCDAMSYLTVRVDGQIRDYYRPQARGLKGRLRRFRTVQAALSIVAVVLGALAARFSGWGLGPWIAVITTVTAAVAAHVAANRYDYLLLEYSRTADELARLRRTAERVEADDELDAVLTECERVISIQNEGWMAKLASDPDAKNMGRS